MMSTLEALLQVSGVIPVLKKILRRPSELIDANVAQDTLAVSPHINFFSYKRVLEIFRDRGFIVSSYQGRMFRFAILSPAW